MDTYSHVLPDRQKAAVAEVQKLLFGQQSEALVESSHTARTQN
jgi:hypothetical protein